MYYSRKIILIFLTIFLNTMIFANENVWLLEPSEHTSLSGKIEEGLNYKDAWFPVNGYTEYFNDIKNSPQTKKGRNYMVLPSYNDVEGTNGIIKSGEIRLGSKLNKILEVGNIYHLNLLFLHGERDNLIVGTKDTFDTEVWIVKSFPQPEDNLDDFLNENGQKIADVLETEARNKWIKKDITFQVESKVDKAEFILLVPRNLNVDANSRKKGFLAIEQGDPNFFEITANSYDKGVDFVSDIYTDMYGVNDKKLVKTERVASEIVLENNENKLWNHQYYFEIDAREIGNIELSSIQILKTKNGNETVLIEGQDYNIYFNADNNLGHIFLKIVDSQSTYKINLETIYDNSLNLKTYNLKLIDKNDYSDKAYLSSYTTQVDKTYDKNKNIISGDHNIIEIDGEIVRFGEVNGDDNGFDDGWTPDSLGKSLYLGKNSLDISSSHQGWLGIYANLGTLQSDGSYKMIWTKVYDKEIKAGRQNIEVFLPESMDTVTELVFKYAIDRADIMSLENTAKSGESEYYEVTVRKTFDVEILEFNDLGVPTENVAVEPNLEIKDGKYSFAENVEYFLKITNNQIEDISNKKIIFTSNTVDLDVSSFEVFDSASAENEIFGKVLRIEKRKNTDGIYDILFGKLKHKEIIYLKINGKILREDTINWNLDSYLKEGNLVLDSLTREMNSREYGDNIYGDLDESTEVRHYEVKNNGEGLFLGEKVNYKNEIETDSPTNDGVTLPTYQGSSDLYKGKYVLFTGGILSEVRLKVNSSLPISWISVFLNKNDRFQDDESDRAELFMANKKSGAFVQYDEVTSEYYFNIMAPDQPGAIKNLRFRLAYNEHEIRRPLTTASSGEIEDYEVVLLPPIEATVLKVEDLGVGNEELGKGNGVFSFGEKIRYTVKLKNLVNKKIENRGIEYRTNMVDMNLDSVRIIKGNSKEVTVTEIPTKGVMGRDKDFHIIFDSFETHEEIEITFEGTLAREDKENWKLIDSILSENVVWVKKQYNDLNRTYGQNGRTNVNIQSDTRHYELVDGIYRLGDSVSYLNDFNLRNDGVVFPKDSNNLDSIYENTETDLKVYPSHDGYVTVWAYRSSGWEDITLEPTAVMENQENIVKVKILNALDQQVKLRVRYAKDREDVESLETPARTGEVENYMVVVRTPLISSFGEDVELGIKTTVGDERVGAGDGYYSYKEDIEYSLLTRNVTSGVVENPNFQIETTIGIIDLLDSDKFEIYSKKQGESDFSLDNNSRVVIKEILKETNRTVYNIAINEVLPYEELDVRIKFNISRDSYYIVNGENTTIKYDLTDTLYLSGIEMDKKSKEVGPREYENVRIGYGYAAPYYRSQNRTRHGIVKNREGIHIGLGDALSIDSNYIEGDVSTDDGIVLRTDVNDGVDSKYHSNGGERAGNILYNRAINRIPVTVTDDGYVGVWVKYISSYDGFDYNIANHSWEGALFSGVQKVNKGLNYIDVDLRGADGWLYSGINSDSNRPYIVRTHTGFVRVRYSKNPNEVGDSTGVASIGEIEDYKIDNFSTPYIIDFVDLQDLGLDTVVDITDSNTPIIQRTGEDDGHLTIGEEYYRTIKVKNVTRSKQPNARISYRTKVTEMNVSSDYEVVNGDSSRVTLAIASDFKSNGYGEKEYYIDIKDLEPEEEILIKIKFKVNDTTYPSFSHSPLGNYVISEKLLFQNRIINSNTITLEQDRGFDGGSTYHLKNFLYKIDNEYVALGNNVDFESGAESETGDATPEEGILNFEKDKNNKNVLFSGIENSLNIKATHNGYISLWSNVGSSNNWVNILPPTLIKKGVNDVRFIMPNALEGMKDKIFRVRYGVREKDVTGLDYKVQGATGEIEDYIYTPISPLEITYRDLKDLGTDIDLVIAQEMGIEKIGIEDTYFTMNEDGELKIDVENLSILPLNNIVLNEKLVKLSLDKADIVDVSAVDSKDNPFVDFEMIKGRDDGVYYIKIHSLQEKTKITFTVKFKVLREEGYDYIMTHKISQASKINNTSGEQLIHTEVTNSSGVDAGTYWDSIGLNVYIGRHYRTKESPKLGDIVNFNDSYYEEKNPEDNDGVTIIKDEGLNTLVAGAKNSIDIKITHPGYVQLWLHNPREGSYKIYSEPQKVNSDTKSLIFDLPQNNITTPTNKDNYILFVKYGQIKSEVDRVDGGGTSPGTVSGETETYNVKVTHPIDIKFVNYQELGVDINGTVYGINDGNVGLGERVRQTIVVENRSTAGVDQNELANSVIEFRSNNGVVDLNDLNLDVQVVNKLTKSVVDYIDNVSLIDSSGKKFKITLKKIDPNTVLMISFDYIVKEDNDKKVINKLYLRDQFGVVIRDDTTDAKLENNSYPDMKIDYSSKGSVRHHYVKEIPRLGETVGHEDLTVETEPLENDGLEIKTFLRFKEEGDPLPTLFSDVNNDIKVTASENGFVRFYLNDKVISESLEVIKGENILQIVPPKSNESANGESNDRLTVRYSLDKNELDTVPLNSPSKIGEVEDYIVRVLPPLEGYFKIKEPGETRDLGVQLNSTAAIGAGTILGDKDGEIVYREVFKEVIQLNDVAEQPGSVEIVISSNTSEVVHDYNTLNSINSIPTIDSIEVTSENGKNLTVTSVEKNGYTTKITVNYEAGFSGKISFKMKVTKEDRTNWKVINNLKINITQMDNTNPPKEDKDHIYYSKMLRDYENATTWGYSYDTRNHKEYMAASTGARQYLIKSANGNDYVKLGELNNAERTNGETGSGLPISLNAPPGKLDDDDSLTPGDINNSSSELHERDRKYYLYNNSMNRFPIEVNEDGYVTIWLWRSRHTEGFNHQAWDTSWHTQQLTSTPIHVKKGKNIIDLKIPHQWYSSHIFSFNGENRDLQDEMSNNGVLRIKYSLESDGAEFKKGYALPSGDAGFIGEIEDYSISAFLPPIRIENIEIVDNGFEDSNNSGIYFDKNNGSLAYSEEFDYVVTLKNVSTSLQPTLTLQHLNDGDYRELLLNGNSTDTQQVLTYKNGLDSSLGSATRARVIIEKNGTMTIENIESFETITLTYKAKIIKEGQLNYDEENPLGDWKKREYHWYGLDEFWMDSRKLVLNHDHSQIDSSYIEKGKNYILKGSGSDGDGNDYLTSRDYGNAYIGINNEVPTILNEVRHYRGYISPTKVMMIGREIDFENTIRDTSPIEFDGIRTGHAKINGENVLYAGVTNRLYIEINHPGYVSFFLNEDDFISGTAGSGSWKNTDIVNYTKGNKYEEGVTEGSSLKRFMKNSGGPIHYFDSPGIWVVDLQVPEYAHKTKVLRVRYGSFEEELMTPLGMSRTGEVQDHKIKILPLETGFEGSKDLGVPTEFYETPSERLGMNDGIYSYKELYETMFSVHNTSEYEKKDAEIVIYSNTSEVYQEEIDNNSWYFVMDKNEGLDWSEENSLATSKGNGSTQEDKALKIISQKHTQNGIEIKIRIPKMFANEMVRIKLNMQVVKEDKTLWKVRNNLVINNENQGEQLLSSMFRDYGNGTLIDNSLAENEVRHYSVKTIDKKEVKLGGTINTEDIPNDSEDDGVILPVFNNEFVIYNNLINRLPLLPSHKGYASVHFTNDTESWTNPDTFFKVDENLEETNEKVSLMEPKDDSKNIRVKAKNYTINTNGILRVRYALDKEDLSDEKNTNLIDLPARSGEVEDYSVRVISGLELNFEYPEDLGLTINNGHEDLFLGRGDGNLVLGESIKHKVVIKNITETDQKNIKFIYKTVVTAPIYNRENNEDTDKFFKIYLRERDESGNVSDTLLRDRTVKMSYLFNEDPNDVGQNYEVEISSIREGETLVFEFYGVLVAENEIHWRLRDELYLDGEQKDEVEFPMVRDYGNGYVAGNSTLKEEAKHYYIKHNNQPVRLGEKLKTDEQVNVGDDDDGVVNWEIVDNRLVLYNNLKNMFQLKPSVNGFVTFWINSSTTSNIESKWNDSKDIVLATRDIDKNNYKEKNMTLVNHDVDILYTRLPSYLGQEKILRVRYTIDKDDNGILKPVASSRTGEVEDYRFVMEDGFDVSALGIIDRGINSDEATGDEEQDKFTRIGVEDSNVSNRELVDTIVKVVNKTPLEQNGFTDETKDGIKFHIDNGSVDETYIKLVSIDKDGNRREFINTIDENWNPNGEISSPNGDHRVRIRENTNNPYNKGKYYDVLIDKIYAKETLEIYIRQKVSDEFITQKDGKWVIQNTVLFNRAGLIPGEVITSPVGTYTLPMMRDYGVPLNNENYQVEARHYETMLVSGEEMRLGDGYSTEEHPGALVSETDDGLFYGLDTKELAQNFWNEVPIKLNNRGFISIWIENEKLELSKEKDSDNNILNSVTELEVDETIEKVYLKVPKDIFINGLDYKLRIRYAYNHEDVINRIGPAGSGEVEDYIVRIIPGLDLNLLDETIDKGVLPQIGVEDGYVTVGESIERFVTLENKSDINQHEIDFSYYTDIGEVYKNYFKVMDVDGNIIENTAVTISDAPLLPTDIGGKRYKLTLDNLYASKLHKIVILERVLTEPAQNKVWGLLDEASYLNVTPIKREVIMERDYGSNLLKTKMDKFNEIRHYFVTYDNNGIKEPVQLGSKWNSEDVPKNETTLDDGLIFGKQEGKNILLNNMRNEIELKISHSGFITVLMSDGLGVPGETRETEFSTILIEPTFIQVNNPEETIKLQVDIPDMGEYLENNNLSKIIRIRYSLNKDEIQKGHIYSATGEVEDYKVQIVRGLDIKFDKEFNSKDNKYRAKDLGIPESEYPLDFSGKRVGYDDENITLSEEVENQIKILNPTPLNQENLEFYYTTNVSEILQLREVGLDGRVSFSEVIGNKPNSIYKIYKVNISQLEANEEIKINIIEKVTQENLFKTNGNFEFENQIWMDLENPTKPELVEDRVFTQSMDRDYGDKYLQPNTSTTDTRHYIVKKDEKFVELTRGETLNKELLPVYQEDDGVKFDMLSEDNIIRNDFKNPIKIYASHTGYISMYLTKLKTKDNPSAKNWNDAVEILTENGTTVSSLRVEAGENDVIIDVPNFTDEYSKHQYVRVRYALNEAEVNSQVGVAKSGEIEDYKVVISTGVNVKLINLIEPENLNIPKNEKENLLNAISSDGDGEYLDLGLSDINGIREVGKGDSNIGPLESYMQVAKLTNLTIENQANVSAFVLNSNISSLDMSYSPKVYVERDGVFSYDPSRVITVNTLSSGEKELFLNNLNAQETIYIKFKMKNQKEDTINFETMVNAKKDSEIADSLSYPMKRDYGLDKNTTKKLSGRNYLTWAVDLDNQKKEVKLGDTLSFEEIPGDESEENNGADIIKNNNNEFIMFNDFDNLIPLNISHNGYVKIWLNRDNSFLTPLLTKDDLTRSGIIYKTPNILTQSNKDQYNLLRVNYSLYDQDLRDYNNFSNVGETEDYKVKFVLGFKVEFNEVLDLGIAGTSFENEVLVGVQDGNISLNEEFIQTISIENLSKLPQKNKKLRLDLNIGEVLDLNSIELSTSKVGIIDLSNNSYENEVFTDKSIISNVADYIEFTPIIGGNSYWISVKNIDAREKFEIKYKVKVTNENIINEVTSTLIQRIYDGSSNILLNEKILNMTMDIGNNFGLSDDETRHYLTLGDKSALLGVKTIINNNQNEDGVTLLEKDGVKILYKKMLNKIKVVAKEDGYITLWLSDELRNSPSWKLNTEKLELFYENEVTKISTKAAIIKIQKGENNLAFKLPDHIDQSEFNRVLRVRYSVNKEEIEDLTTPSSSGEVEDYLVKIDSGILVYFDSTEDLGQNIDITPKKTITVGKNDGNFSLYEDVEHIIAVKNLSELPQYNQEIFYQGNIVDVNESGADGTSFIIPKINPGEIIKTSVKIKIIKENLDADEFKFKLKERVWHDTNIPDFTENSLNVKISNMKRDYGDEKALNENHNEAKRAYLTTGYLGDKVTNENFPKDNDEDDGVIFIGNKLQKQILFKNLENKVLLTASEEGYVSLSLLSNGLMLNSTPIYIKKGVNEISFNLDVSKLNNSLDEDILRVIYSTNKDELHLDVISSGEIEDYKVKLIDGLSTYFGRGLSKKKYEPRDLGTNIKNILIGKEDGFYSPTEIIEHVITISNNTSVDQEMIETYLEVDKAKLIRNEYNGMDYELLSSKADGEIELIETIGETTSSKLYKIKVLNIKAQRELVFKVKFKIDSEKLDEVKTRLAIYLNKMPEYNDENNRALNTIKLLLDLDNFASGAVYKHYLNGSYYLGKNYTFENSIETLDDTDGIIEVNNEKYFRKNGDITNPIFMVKGQDLKLKIKHSNQGFLKVYLFGSDMGVYPLENKNGESEIIIPGALTASYNFSTELKIRFASSEDELKEENEYSLTGEVESYEVIPLNTKVIKYSITESDDDIAEPGEKVTYTIEATNPTNKKVLWNLIENISENLENNGDLISVLDKDSITLEYLNKRKNIKLANNIFYDESTKILQVAKNNLGEPIEIEPKTKLKLSYVIKVNKKISKVYDGYVLDSKTTKIEHIGEEKNEELIIDETPPILKIDDLELNKKKLFLIERNGIISDKITHVIPNDKIIYIIELYNPNEVSNWNVKFKDSLEENKLLKFASYINDSLKVINHRGEKLDYEKFGDIEGIIKRIKPKERVYISFELLVDYPLDELLDYSFLNTAYIDDDDNLYDDLENDKPTVEGPFIENQLKLEKSVIDENKNGQAEPEEKLTYILEIKNFSNVEKNLILEDDLQISAEDSNGVSKNYPLIKVVNFIENSIIFEKDDSDNFSKGSIIYNENSSKLMGEISVKAQSTIRIKFKVQMKEFIPKEIELGDSLVNKGVIFQLNGNKMESICKIPIAAELKYELISLDKSGDGIVESGEVFNYKIILKNPYHKELQAHIHNDLSNQENHEVDIMKNILKYSEIVDDTLEVISNGNISQNSMEFIKKSKKNIGVQGEVSIPGASDQEYGVTNIVFNMKALDDIPEEILESIDEYIEKNPNVQGAPIHNKAYSLKAKAEVNLEYNEIKDMNPLLLQPVERGELIKIVKKSNKTEVSVGDLIGYEISVKNEKTTGSVSKFTIEDILPTGFRYKKGTSRVFIREENNKYKKLKVEPKLQGNKLIYYIDKLEAQKEIKITYLLKVSTGITPGEYENLAIAKNKNNEKISNIGRALVTVKLDSLFDTSVILGKVFHDRDKDGWQDDATARDIVLKTLTNNQNYFNENQVFIKREKKWEIKTLNNGLIGDLDGKYNINQDVIPIYIRRKIKNPNIISKLSVETKDGSLLILHEDLERKVGLIEKGAKKRGETGENIKIGRRILQSEDGYYEELQIYNFGVYEEGIPDVKLSTICGKIITTDSEGRYHIKDIPLEGVLGNNFILKVNKNSLPKGAKFTTPNPLIKRVNKTIEKYNFGIYLE